MSFFAQEDKAERIKRSGYENEILGIIYAAKEISTPALLKAVTTLVAKIRNGS